MDRSTHIPTRNSVLPGYNDVSGAVIVDYNGLPHFLSPYEKRERETDVFLLEAPMSRHCIAAVLVRKYETTTAIIE
ncbi:hypothetical protein EYZ11_006888 [Aspergillus tanneri]|uniref:Uncharacterized protein n=1 Tax=Aspergillus tanneri TaxID=1220188 RepID=A0A4S3JGT3_9EURO|nr:uncharacterized protein ATNIH1004_008749 [Aspergillus tanneri]KAA8644545.1 hypothetical protein ATNIH1004_008749 [Aspergillus tanneri]THC93638.1 hypothetical protein EYZ11_006888 [Aspergillus tanneri]